MATNKEVLLDKKTTGNKTIERYVIDIAGVNGVTIKTVETIDGGKAKTSEVFHEGMCLSLECTHNGAVVPHTSPRI